MKQSYFLSIKLIKQISFILLLSLFMGLVPNFPLIKKYFQGEYQYGFVSLEEYPSITFITLAEAEELFSQDEALFIDSRDKKAFKAGHILRAINIPFMEYKKRGYHNLLSIPLEKTLVVYCDGSSCQSSITLAKLLHRKGFKNINVFFGGWAEWLVGELPVSSEDDS